MKKAMSQAVFSTLLALILVLIVSTISFSMILKFKEKAESYDNKVSRCKASVLKAASSKDWLSKKTMYPLDCPRINVEVGVDELGANPEYSVKKAVADEMASCWAKMGRGSAAGFNENVMKQVETFWGFEGADQYVCVSCSTVSFTDDVVEKIRRDEKTDYFTGFKKFLEDTPMSGSTTKYSEYLNSGYGQVGSDGKFSALDNIVVSQDYHIFYVVYKGAFGLSYLNEHFGTSFDSTKAYGTLVLATENEIANVKCAGGLLN